MTNEPNPQWRQQDEQWGQPQQQWGQQNQAWGQPQQQWGQPQQQWGTPQHPWQPGSEIPQDDRAAAAIAHGSTLLALVLSAGWVPFLGPLLVWVMYKDRSPYVRHAAASAFNFNIWLTLANIVAWLLIFTVVGIPVSVFIFVVTTIMQVWCHLRGTLRSLEGKDYRYPFQTRILS